MLEETCKKIGHSGATLIRILKAKDYRMCLSFILLCTDALVTLEIRMFVQYWMKIHPKEILPSPLSTLEHVEWEKIDDKQAYIGELVSSMKQFSTEFKKFIQILSQRSENFHFINTFLWSDASSLIQLLHSIQTGDFESRVTACKRMTPLFFSMDAVNYKK